MRIASVVGARPQFVKLGPMCRAFDALPSDRHVAHGVIHTGQHYDAAMSDAFFRDLELPTPDASLGVGSGSHGAQTGQMLQRLEDAFLRESPDLVLVYGDTNSTLAAALAAVKLHIPVAHVEAGLRSFRKSMPEEVNRVLTDHVSTFLFCPTTTSVDNLAKEGIASGVDPLSASVDAPAVVRTGDVMKDAVDQNLERAARRPRVAARLGVDAGRYAVATIHRAENTDDFNRLRGIAEGLAQVGRELQVVVPLHPRTRKAMSALGIRMDSTSVRWIDPLSYLDMLQLVSQAKLVLTDSGGLQKEAYLLGVPCVTLRDETEWVELVEAGRNRLAGADPVRILAAARDLLASSPGSDATNLYGDGRAAERIVEVLSRVGR
jgi:UDP-GlcNAc3NAcA epimerase